MSCETISQSECCNHCIASARNPSGAKRLNKYTLPLKPQELRNATYPGPFAKLSEQLADDDYWAVNRIISPARIRRMGDIEMMSDLLIGLLHPFMGSGSTIAAAKSLSLKSVGVEIDPGYFRLAKRAIPRLARFSNSSDDLVAGTERRLSRSAKPTRKSKKRKK